MRRFVTLAFLFLFTIPFGISIGGCGKKTAVVFCNGSDSGPVAGQLTTITLQPSIFGISLNEGEFGQIGAVAGTDCKGSSVTPSSYLYSTTDKTIADINPTNGRLCGGNWNRNTGGGIPDYTVCNVTNKVGTAYITASANSATSNPVPVFVHPVATSVILGAPSVGSDCTGPDPASNCSPAATTTSANSISCTIAANGCCTVPPVSTAQGFTPNSCLSQGASGQLAARVYSGTGSSQKNISCQVGHLTYSPQTAGIVAVDENGIATAQQPGSTILTSSLSQAGSTAGFFSTCPPQTITLAAPNTTVGPDGIPTVTVNQNNTLPITATVTDTHGVPITGLALNFVSTTPTTLPSGGTGTATPIFPGSGSITAVCQPPTCNSAPLNEIGLFGNGKPVTSNNIVINTPGNNSSILYAASTQSLYIVSVDFTTTVVGAPVRLPYIPNSMVISEDGSTIYMGSATELMVLSSGTTAVSAEYLNLPGPVLAVSPDNTTLVITDPVRQTVSLVNSSGGTIQTTYGGVGTHASFSPDSTTVYISAGNQILIHSAFTGWTSVPASPSVTDVAVTVPSVGAFFAGSTTTARSYCALTSTSTSNGQTTTSNVFFPDAGVAAPSADRLAATNDGVHILGATAAGPQLTDLRLGDAAGSGLPKGQCPADGSRQAFTASPVGVLTIPNVAATSITGIDPTSDSAFSFITYAGAGGVLPLYQPAGTGVGTLSSVKLSGAAVAPVAGVFSSDNATFFVGTSGDNLVHLVKRSGSTYTDSSTIAPKLPDASGNLVTPNLLVQKPRPTT